MKPEASKNGAALRVRGARTHNLKSIDCRVPHGKVTVVTGPSGAGKSSLAFDTIYAEAQRRFIESMSTYARQFLEQMERPPVEEIEGILPAVALVARNSVKNARSTVGTITEVYDVLRLLFANLGHVQCSSSHGDLAAAGPSQACQRLLDESAGEQLTVLAPLARPARDADAKLRELVRQGYTRIQAGDEIERLGPKARWLKRLDPLPVVVGRFRAVERSRSRLTAGIEEAYRLTGGSAEILGGAVRHLGRGLTCGRCGETAARPQPALFSYNSPLGACPACRGFGRVVGIDRARVVPDGSRSLREKPIAPWNSPAYEELYEGLWQSCLDQGIDLDCPWTDLDESSRGHVWRGRGFTSIERFFAWLERRNYKMHIRVLLSRYRAYEPCRRCEGSRLRPESLAVLVAGSDIAELSRLSIEDLSEWLAAQTWKGQEQEVASHLLEELSMRLETLCRVGLHYLSLDRQARTLSGGEAQRIQLASALGSGLTSTLYVLDEPTIGLHPKDSQRLVDLLRDLSARGNTVLVVEHDRTLIEGADHVIDLGPRAGEHGGEVVAEGCLVEVLEVAESLTTLYLRGERGSLLEHRGLGRAEVAKLERVRVEGAAENNLRDLDVDLPVGCLIAVTGVSGSGKTTLVQRVLHDGYQRSKGVVEVEPGRSRALLGVDDLADIILVDQRPLGRSSRSNPVTYMKAYDEIRKTFAAQPRAQRDSITAGHFSFNVDKGRCPECEGTGEQEVDMQFMASVRVRCDRCQGHRFKPEILEVTWRGLNIAETLELTVDAAIEHFEGKKRVLRRLQALVDVGLAYLRLGQPTATLSGGEAQRLKLASFLDAPAPRGEPRPRLFLFDEPTTGLHMADIDLLHQTLRRLVERGDGVVVVEHSLDLIARADWVVDLGPGGGEHGGELLFVGPIDDFLAEGEGPTASELRDFCHSARRIVA
jgi:excinuclease ABC subunit A